jgi:hypothetical protein
MWKERKFKPHGIIQNLRDFQEGLPRHPRAYGARESVYLTNFNYVSFKAALGS